MKYIIFIILIIGVIIFFYKHNSNDIIILADNKPFKVKPNSLHDMKENTAFDGEIYKYITSFNRDKDEVFLEIGEFTTRKSIEKVWSDVLFPIVNRDGLEHSILSKGDNVFYLRIGPFKKISDAKNLCKKLFEKENSCLYFVN